MTAITFKGEDRFGSARTGQTDGSPAVLVLKLYNARYRSLTVHRGDIEVGGIGPDPETGKRTWWGES